MTTKPFWLALLISLTHLAVAWCEDTVDKQNKAPRLNGTYAFQSEAADMDNLLVDTGKKKAKVTGGLQVHGHDEAFIKPDIGATGPSAHLHCATVTNRQGDSLYSVWGIIVPDEGKAAKGKQKDKDPEDWTNVYETGGPWIMLEVNRPGDKDNYVWLEDTDATLSVRVAGGQPKKPYTVTITDDGAPGDVDAIVLPRPIVGPDDVVTVPIKGLRLGKVALHATTADAAKPGHITPEVVDFSVEVTKLSFTSDHRLLFNNDADYSAERGKRLTRPDWTRGDRNQPISHTMDQPMTAVVTIKVVPLGAPSRSGLRVVGEFLPGLPFEVEDVTLRGGLNEVATSTNKNSLPAKIHKAKSTITWTVHRKQRGFPAGETGEHVVYVTYDTPRDVANPLHYVTIKRMDRAVNAASGSPALGPEAVAEHVIAGMKPHFDVEINAANAWDVPDTDGDCQSIIRYGIKVLKMVGIPGEFRHVNIYAIETAPKVPIVGGKKNGLGNPTRYTHPTQRTWYVGLTSGEATFNGFNGCLELTHGNSKRYFVGGHSNDNGKYATPLDVLYSFRAMSWYETVGVGGNIRRELRGDIHKYDKEKDFPQQP